MHSPTVGTLETLLDHHVERTAAIAAELQGRLDLAETDIHPEMASLAGRYIAQREEAIDATGHAYDVALAAARHAHRTFGDAWRALTRAHEQITTDTETDTFHARWIAARRALDYHSRTTPSKLASMLADAAASIPGLRWLGNDALERHRQHELDEISAYRDLRIAASDALARREQLWQRHGLPENLNAARGSAVLYLAAARGMHAAALHHLGELAGTFHEAGYLISGAHPQVMAEIRLAREKDVHVPIARSFSEPSTKELDESYRAMHAILRKAAHAHELATDGLDVHEVRASRNYHPLLPDEHLRMLRDDAYARPSPSQ